MRETEEEAYPDFHLMLGFSQEVTRGLYQFGVVIDEQFQTITYGSCSELGDGYFTNGVIENLRQQGCGGEFYILVNENDMEFFLNENGEFVV